MILTPNKHTPTDKLEHAKRFFLSLGFASTVVTTPHHHDQIIAYTSQLAHVVSSAYMQSPTAKEHMSFSAGSFADLTRVAKLNPEMWTQLFLLNQEPLVSEIDTLLDFLTVYRDCIKTGDAQQLQEMLRKGDEIKQNLTKNECKE